jgi:uncharacterized RDD family membrane protein YckC
LSQHGQPNLKLSGEPAWKQEVARRLAAHKNRKGAPATAEAPAQEQHFGTSLAAKAAARVAARYAKAPSYSEMQAEEARLAVRTAEIATKVALEAQAAAEEALAELHAAAAEQKRGPAVVESITSGRVEAVEELAPGVREPEIVIDSAPEPEWSREEPVLDQVPEAAASVLVAQDLVAQDLSAQAPVVVVAPVAVAEPQPEPVITRHVIDGRSFGIRWESDAPVRVLEPRTAPAPETFELDREDWWTPAEVSATLRNEPIAIETDPGAANLIEFPREIVATRKMRPRLAEPVSASASERQLSIFEVDPQAVSTEPEPAETVSAPWAAEEWAGGPWSAPTVAASDDWSSATVSGPKWSGMELDAHPVAERRAEPEPAHAAQQIKLAPFGWRLMAMAVDGCLILAGFFAAAMMLASRLEQPLTPRGAEMFVACGLVLAGFLYNALFLALGVCTPGMRYAGIALSTFEDEVPTRAQLCRRLGAMVLSLAPVGLGLVWSVFDEDHLSWHDRMSQTYLRRR